MKPSAISIVLMVASLLCLAAAFAPLLGSPPAPSAPIGRPPPTRYLIDRFDPQVILDLVDKSVRDDDGDLEHQSLRLALGVATGGFGRDPVAERALRETGAQLLNHLLVPGDEVSLFGFEMEPRTGAWGLPFGPESRSRLAGVWGDLQPGQGGIDFNAALRTAMDQLHPAAGAENVLIVLLSPHDSSETPQGAQPPPPLVALDPDLLAKAGLKRLDPYPIPYVQRQGNQQREVFATLVLSSRFLGPPLPPEGRSGLLRSQSAAQPVVASAGQSAPVPVPPVRPRPNFILLLLGVGVAITGLLLSRDHPAAQLTVRVNGAGSSGSSSFHAPWRRGWPICRVVGPGLDRSMTGDIVIGAEGRMPAMVLAEVWPEGRSVVVKSAAFSVAGERGLASVGYPIDPGPMQWVKISGKAPVKPGLAPVPFDIRLEITLR